MELQGGEGIDVDEGGDGANVGRLLHGVGVGVEGSGENVGNLHGVMFMGFFSISGSHFQMIFLI